MPRNLQSIWRRVRPVSVQDTRLRDMLDEISREFNLDEFTLEHFCEWIGARRGRPILLVGWEMPVNVFGTWLAAGDVDYVFFDKNTNALHQTHIVLHELCHILLNHETLVVDGEETTDIFGALLEESMDRDSALQGMLMRSVDTRAEDVEAERLSEMLQERLLRRRRLIGLTMPVVSSEALAALYRNMQWMNES